MCWKAGRVFPDIAQGLGRLGILRVFDRQLKILIYFEQVSDLDIVNS